MTSTAQRYGTRPAAPTSCCSTTIGPLAIIEIERETVAITQQDYGQAQSYANMLTPRAPLVIVSNGNDTRCYDASPGAEWKPGSDASAKVQKLLTNAAKIATVDMRWAVE
jgi:type I site-specific restriction endonuclease